MIRKAQLVHLKQVVRSKQDSLSKALDSSETKPGTNYNNLISILEGFEYQQTRMDALKDELVKLVVKTNVLESKLRHIQE